MKKITCNSNTLKRAITILLLMISLISQAQENLWEVKPKGENPWATDSETPSTKEEKPSITNPPLDKGSSVEKPKQTTPQTNASSQTIAIVNDKNYAENHSTATERYFNFNDTIIKLNTNSFNYYKSLRLQGRKMHKANLALGMGIASASFINVLALPFNLVTSAIPTPLTRYRIKQFIEDNPHASKKEINAVRLGISGKRFSNAVVGVAIGCALNFAAIIVIVAISF